MPKPRSVLLVSEEDGRRQVKHRLKLLIPAEEQELWGDRLRLLIESGLQLDDRHWQESLEASIKEHGIEIVILNVWRWLHSADTNSEKELKPILTYLTDLQRCFGITILILTHNAKPKQGPEGNREARRITGNWSQWAWAQFGWFLKKRGNVVEVQVESKDLEASSFAFRFTQGEQGLQFVWQPPQLSDIDARRKRVTDYLIDRQGRWTDLATIAEACQASPRTVHRDLEALASVPGFEKGEWQEGRAKKKGYRYVERSP